MHDQHLYKNPAKEVYGHCRSADYYYPDWGWLVEFFSNLGLKIAGMGGWVLNPQP